MRKVLGSQQESADFSKDMDALIDKYSTDGLYTALAPKIVEIQKGRPKVTKINKLGVEYEDKKKSLSSKKMSKKLMKQETVKVEKLKRKKKKKNSLH